MGRSLLLPLSSMIPPQFCKKPSPILPRSCPKVECFWSCNASLKGLRPTPTRRLCTRGVFSEVNSYRNQKQFFRVGADSTGPIPSRQLLQVVETAAQTGAQIVMDAVNRPRNITYKGLTDLVTDTDKMSEAAILDIVRKNFPNHLILGEEGGLIGDSSSDYLWCIDPLGLVHKSGLLR